MDKNLNITANFIDNASPQIDNLDNQLNEIGKGFVTGAIVAAAGLVIEKFAEMTKAAIDFGDQLNDMAERWGIATNELSGMAYAAQLADTSLEGLTTGFRKLGKSMEEAKDPTSEQAELFEQMGVSVKNADGSLRDVNDVMLDVADVFKDLPNGIEKANLAIRLFGKSGVDLIPYLNQGAEGIRKMKQEAEEFGVIWKPEQAAQAGEFNDNLDRMALAVKGLFTQIAQGLLPTLLTLSEAIIASAKEGGILHAVFDILKTVVFELDNFLKPFILGIYILTTAFSSLGKIIGGVAAALVEFLSGNFENSSNIVKSMKEDIEKTGEEVIKFHNKLMEGGNVAKAVEENQERTTKSFTKTSDSVKKLNEDIEKYLANLRKTRDEIGMNDEQKQRYELEQKIVELKKQGASLDQLNKVRSEASAIITETAARKDNYDATQKQVDAEIKLNEVRKTVIDTTSDIKFENSLIALSNEQRKIAIELRKVEKAMVGATAEEIAKLTAEREKELKIQQEQTKLEGLLAGTADEKIKASQENMLLLTKAFEQGKISEEKYLDAVQLELERVSIKTRQTTDEMTEFFREAAKNIQNALSDTLFDFMQGKMTNLGQSIKTMIDRMVANFLAAKAATALFGADFGKGDGQMGGIVGGLITSIAGARANGGPVEAGKTYIVGEKRPELFTPSQNGFISPDLAAVGGTSNNVTISISALDGADVMRVLGQNKREIANLVTSANRTYNLRGA